jgi:pyruvate dehydrogenase E2 component (dihydrolipoamide acetyltransferase)
MAGARIPVTPRAKLVAKERDLGWRFLVGSGPSGRLRERDVLAYGEEVASLDVTPAARRLAAQKQVDLREIEGTGPAGRITEHDVARAEPSMPAGGFERRELDAMRRTIAHRMSWSWRNMPQFSLTVAVDMSAASRTRERIKEEGTKVSFTDMIVKAAALALRDHPEVASLFDRDTVIRRAGLHVGIAVALDEGLIVPVVRHADKRPLVELSAAAKDLVARARSNRLIPDEYTGGVLTVSNMGMLGIDEFTAIVNPGESAIVACGRILDAPVVVEGEVVARPVLTLTGAFDHRAVDGAQGARYLSRVKELLESPEELV